MSKWIFSVLFIAQFAHAGIKYSGDVIRNASTPFALRHQGICHDENYFYLTQKNKIWQIPRTNTLDKVELRESRQLEIPQQLKHEGADHLGDCEVDRGLLYVPVEGTRPLKIMIVSTRDLQFISAPDLPLDQTHAPWVTVDPIDGTILTGGFTFVPNQYAIIKFQLSADSKTLHELWRSSVFDADGKQMSVDRVQAAKIIRSKNALLILSDSTRGEILNFNLTTLHLQDRISISRYPGVEELEGLDAFETGETGNIPGNIIVTMVSHARIFTDRFYLKAFQWTQ